MKLCKTQHFPLQRVQIVALQCGVMQRRLIGKTQRVNEAFPPARLVAFRGRERNTIHAPLAFTATMRKAFLTVKSPGHRPLKQISKTVAWPRRSRSVFLLAEDALLLRGAEFGKIFFGTHGSAKRCKIASLDFQGYFSAYSWTRNLHEYGTHGYCMHSSDRFPLPCKGQPYWRSGA